MQVQIKRAPLTQSVVTGPPTAVRHCSSRRAVWQFVFACQGTPLLNPNPRDHHRTRPAITDRPSNNSTSFLTAIEL